MVQVLSGQNKAVGKGLVLGTASIYFPGFPRRWDAAGTGCASSRPTRDGAASPGTGRDAAGQGCSRPGMLQDHPPGCPSYSCASQNERQMLEMQRAGKGGGTAKMLAGARTSAAPGFQLISSLFIGIERDARVNNSIPKRSPAQGRDL